jgi:hypothetical protein
VTAFLVPATSPASLICFSTFCSCSIAASKFAFPSWLICFFHKLKQNHKMEAKLIREKWFKQSNFRSERESYHLKPEKVLFSSVQYFTNPRRRGGGGGVLVERKWRLKKCLVCF